jgi:hypothetical protein
MDFLSLIVIACVLNQFKSHWLLYDALLFAITMRLKFNKEKNTRDLLSLMLDPRFKNLHLVSSFVGRKEGVNIVDEYDRKTLYPMLLKCYHHLHPMIESIGCVNQTGDEDSSLDIFQ